MKRARRVTAGALSALLVAVASHAQSSNVLQPGDSDLQAEVEYQAFLQQDRVNSAQDRLETIRLERRRIERDMLRRGRAYVRMMRLGLLPMSEGFDSMVAHANRVERLRRSLARDIVAKVKLQREEHELRRGLKLVQTRHELIKEQVLDYRRSREAILAARDRELSYRRAFDSSWDPDDHAAVYSAPAAVGALGKRFIDMKGRLPFPCEGRVEVEEVQLESASGPGAVMAVAPGAAVHAVFAGKVVLTGQYGELGNGVVIDHGGGYSTLSARLESIAVEAGDHVEAGTTLGVVASGGDGPLYFEVRQQGAATDPAEWFGI